MSKERKAYFAKKITNCQNMSEKRKICQTILALV